MARLPRRRLRSSLDDIRREHQNDDLIFDETLNMAGGVAAEQVLNNSELVRYWDYMKYVVFHIKLQC